MTTLIVDNISKHFGTKKVVNQISFSLKHGQRLALTGANGVGKTTLLRILTSLVPPQSGDAVYKNIWLTKNPQSWKTLVGHVPSNELGLFPRLNGSENLYFFSKIYKVRNVKFKLIIEQFMQFDLFQQAYRTPFYQCSSGMKNILLICKSLIHDPTILLWDEPFRSFSPTLQTHLKSFLLQHFQHKIFIYSTHILVEDDHFFTNRLHMGENKIDFYHSLPIN